VLPYEQIIPKGSNASWVPQTYRVLGVFLRGTMANRVAFAIDGFNLYHSVREVSKRIGVNCRWLDIAALCSAFLPEISRDASREAVYYFSALATHAEAWRPGTVRRHLVYINALKSTGVIVTLSSFKAKPMAIKCPGCQTWQTVTRHEEKETDVAVASKVIELAVGQTVDSIVGVTGDTDVIPAVRTARALSSKPVYMLYPVGRRNGAFQSVASGGWRIKEKHYVSHQLPDPVVLPGATIISRPREWT
jgi:uncharacterized LabA/DUF88 family protein